MNIFDIATLGILSGPRGFVFFGFIEIEIAIPLSLGYGSWKKRKYILIRIQPSWTSFVTVKILTIIPEDAGFIVRVINEKIKNESLKVSPIEN